MENDLRYSVLHITDGDPKFIPDLMNFFKEYFDIDAHEFVVVSRFEDRKLNGLKYFNTKSRSSTFELHQFVATFEKVVIHGLVDFYLVLALRKSLVNFDNVYWLLWGGDVYCYQNERGFLRRLLRNWIRKSFISKLRHAGSFIEGGVDLARKWYGFGGIYHECMGYTSNTFEPAKPLQFSSPKSDEWCVVVGNSGFETNFHLEVFGRLKAQIIDMEIKVICPLAYGNKLYIEEVLKTGRKLFGNQFIPIQDFLPKDEYFKILNTVDAGVFAHNREQGTGNVVPLLGMGKKIFARTNVAQWDTYSKLGLVLHDYKVLSSDPLPQRMRDNNMRVVKEYFSLGNLAHQYRKMLSLG